MEYTTFNTNVENVSNLSDLPNENEGLTSAELKAVFDKAGSDIKSFLNGSLIPELNNTIRTINVTFPSGSTDYTFADSTNQYKIGAYTNVICSMEISPYSPPAMIYATSVDSVTHSIAFHTEVAPSQNVNLLVLLLG